MVITVAGKYKFKIEKYIFKFTELKSEICIGLFILRSRLIKEKKYYSLIELNCKTCMRFLTMYHYLWFSKVKKIWSISSPNDWWMVRQVSWMILVISVTLIISKYPFLIPFKVIQLSNLEIASIRTFELPFMNLF